MYYKCKITGGLFTWAIWLLPVATLFAAATAFGAQADTATAVSDAPVSATVAEPDEVQIEGGRIKYIAFQKESDVRDGLRLLAKYWQKNIVPSANVRGPLNCPELRDVTFEQALAAMLGDNFVSEQDGNLIHIRTKEEHRKIKEDPDRMVHKVVTLYYTTAAEASKLIQPVLSSAGRFTVTSAAEQSISAASSGGSGGGGLSGGGGGDNVATNDMIVIFDYPENIERAEAVIRGIDIRPKQVLIEATILSARVTEGMELGVDWNLWSGSAIEPTETEVQIGTTEKTQTESTNLMETIASGAPVGTPIAVSGFANPKGAGLRIGITSGSAVALVTALEQVTDVTVLANPKILAVNKQEGSVLIGKKLGYLDQTTQTQTSTTQSVAFLNTGTQLIFRPYIGSDGYIRMDIYPKDSDGGLNAQGIPDETTTELRTNVIVKDGETVVIGGLFRDTILTSRKQIPLLGNLPVVGAAFRQTNDSLIREEVIILLTPHIIEEPSQMRGSDRAEDVRMKMEGARQAMQPLDRGKLAENAYASAARFYLEGDIDSAMFHVKVALTMRPTYLEARRLYERIIAETDPEELKRIDSIVNQALEQQEAANWKRY